MKRILNYEGKTIEFEENNFNLLNMQDISNIDSSKSITEEEIFSKIWLQPRIVFSFIENHKYDAHLMFIWPVIGIISGLTKAIDKNMGDKIWLDQILLINIISGIFFGWLYYFFYAVGISWTWALIGWNANWKSIFRIMGYACIPFSFSLILIFIEIYLVWISLFQSTGTFYGTPIGLSFFGINCILWIWSTALMIVGISEVQGFPIWKSILNYLFPWILIILIIVFGFWVGRMI
jgi:hypothetical protein